MIVAQRKNNKGIPFRTDKQFRFIIIYFHKHTHTHTHIQSMSYTMHITVD